LVCLVCWVCLVGVVGRNIDEVRRHLEALEFLFSCELERLKIIGIQAGVTK